LAIWFALSRTSKFHIGPPEKSARLEKVNVRVGITRKDEFAVAIDHAGAASRGRMADIDDVIAFENDVGVGQDVAERGIDDGPAGKNNFLRVKLRSDEKQSGKDEGAHE
jgi:hypothetical protein